MPKSINKYDPCLCGNKAFYSKCCKKYHDGELPATAEALMRSRYSAYVLNLVDYIVNTTHPQHPDYMGDRQQWREYIHRFHIQTKFERLEVLEFVDGENEATVSFTVHLRQGIEDGTFTEKSLFEKVDGRWLYKSGELVLNKK